MKNNHLERLEHTALNLQAPDGYKFLWGPVDKIHVLGRYSIVEFRRDNSNLSASDMDRVRAEHNTTNFMGYIDGNCTNHSALTLEECIIETICIARDGINTRLPVYIGRSLGYSAFEAK